jgi:hypothetical protein
MKKKPIDKYIELFGDLTIDKLKHFDHIVDPNIEFTDPGWPSAPDLSHINKTSSLINLNIIDHIKSCLV